MRLVVVQSNMMANVNGVHFLRNRGLSSVISIEVR